MPNAHKPNWDDLRYLLAVAETGTVSGAARKLGVNHATVLRRIAACETRFGIEFFDRTPSGYAVRPDRLRMLDAFRDVEAAVQSAENLAQGVSAPLTGTVRITSTDTFCQMVLPELLMAVRASSERLNLVLLNSNARLDLSRAHADVTVRPTARLGDDMIGEEVARLGFAVYSSPAAGDLWLGTEGPLGRSVVADWMATHVPSERIVAAADSFMVLAQMVRHGIGRAVLPTILGDATPDLKRIRDLPEPSSVGIWVACHADLATVPRITLVRRNLSDALRARADWLSGKASCTPE